jgi:polyhydroxyalkanoate synthase
VSADHWRERARLIEGSWWPAWAAWLEQRGSAEPVAPPQMGAPDKGFVALEPAPGAYVRQR